MLSRAEQSCVPLDRDFTREPTFPLNTVGGKNPSYPFQLCAKTYLLPEKLSTEATFALCPLSAKVSL